MSEYIVDLSKVAVTTTGELGGFDRFKFLQGLPVCEKIVRCRDCKRSIESPAWPGAMECWYIGRGVESDGFCSWGERKEVFLV